MSFHGADVDGLDRTANRCMEGADFADTVAKALEVLVAALEAMSWTGFAAALAAYLKAVVIPWVKYIAKCLRIFGGLLQLASSKQKDASLDAPPVSIPATAWNPPPAPAPTPITPPRLASPQPAIQQTAPGTGAQIGGGTSVAPITSIGRTDGGATTGNVTGGGSVTTTTGITPGGDLWTRTPGSVSPGTASVPTTITPAGSSGGLGTGSEGHAGSPVTPAIAHGTGGAGSSPGSSGSGPVSGPSTGSIGGGSTGTPAEGAATTSGDPGVQSAPLASRAVLGSPSGGTGTGTVDVAPPVPNGGPSAAFAAAPLGLAGVGGAALAALRAKGLRDDDGDDEEDDAL